MSAANRIAVLDHGYVEFMEAWGTGAAGRDLDDRQEDYECGIIEAARQSTQGSFRGWGTDRKLLGHLFNNKPPHATPFEFAGMVIEVQAPILVFREWHRHRTQCLAGDTEISLVSSRGTAYKRTIQEIYNLKYGRPVGTGPECHRAMPNCHMLRVIDERSGNAVVLPMADVWYSGVKEIFEVETAGGLIVKCSNAHPFFTRDGWARVADLSVGIDTGRYAKVAAQERPIPPSLRQGIGVWTTMMRSRLIRDIDACYVCGNPFSFDDLQLDHVEPVYRNLKRALDEENLRPICGPCHRAKTNREQTGAVTKMGVAWDRIVRIERVGEEPTYDIEVGGPHHNFIANGLVVHNSYNEMSARYAPLPDLYWLPTWERCMLANESTRNKQAQNATGEPLSGADAQAWLEEQAYLYVRQEEHYQRGLRIGIPKEVARCGMPVGHYSRMRASANLRNWLGFLTLRADSHAQLEIQLYADAVEQLIRQTFPETWALFRNEVRS